LKHIKTLISLTRKSHYAASMAAQKEHDHYVSHICCVWCRHEFSIRDECKLMDHLLTCDKSPFVQALRVSLEQNEALRVALRKIKELGGPGPCFAIAEAALQVMTIWSSPHDPPLA
jgi:hypothetical protein